MSALTDAIAAEFSLAEAYSVLLPLLIFIIGVVIYAIFIFKFYRYIGRRDIFEIKVKKISSGIGYVLKHLIIFPIITFVWFLVFALLLSLLTRNQPAETILLIAMTLVAAIRITAYYKEDLSFDLAKIIPLALLGIALIDISFISFDTAVQTIQNIASFWKPIVYYLLFIVLLEFVLRIVYTVAKRD